MFKVAEGISYLRFFGRMHARHHFDWYMEIGCRSGRILRQCQGKTIGVDPVFRIKSDLLGEKPALHLFQEESDTFFANDRLKRLGIKPGVIFVDGMHLMEYALRDIMNAEKSMTADGVIFVHDCFPYTYEMTTRDLGNLPRIWTGDVWKLIPILQKYRPELKLTAIDASPTGLLAITGLRPRSSVLKNAYNTIVADWQNVTLQEYGVAKFNDSFEFSSGWAMVKQNFPMLSKVSIPPEQRDTLKVITP